MNNSKTVNLVLLALFTAIELLFCFTVLGSLPLGLGIVATLAHIPPILIAQLMGKKAALYMGILFGVCSFIVWTYMPPNPAVAFAFTPFAPHGNIFSLLICILPRAIFPVVAAMLFGSMRNKIKTVPAAALSAVIGTLVHSLLVLSGIYFAFRNNQFVGGDYIKFIIAWGGWNAVMEIIVAGIISAAITGSLLKLKKV